MSDEHTFPDFDGWTTTFTDAEGGPREFRFTKGLLLVTIRFGAEMDPIIAYERGVRDCYMEDVRVATETGSPDLATWQQKQADAHRVVVLRKVAHGLAKDFGEDYAATRLMNAGYSLADATAAIATITAQNGG